MMPVKIYKFLKKLNYSKIDTIHFKIYQKIKGLQRNG